MNASPLSPRQCVTVARQLAATVHNDPHTMYAITSPAGDKTALDPVKVATALDLATLRAEYEPETWRAVAVVAVTTSTIDVTVVSACGCSASATIATRPAAVGAAADHARRIIGLDTSPDVRIDGRTVAEVAHDLGITVDDIAEIYTGTDPAITRSWFAALDDDGTGIGTGNPTPFAEQTLTPIGRQDIVAHVDQLSDLEGCDR